MPSLERRGLGAVPALRLLSLLLLLACLLTAPASYLRAETLSRLSRLLITASVIVSTLALQAALLTWLRALQLLRVRHAAAGQAARIATLPALFVAIVLYGASWFSFVRGGPFVSRAILQFLANDPAHLLVLMTPTEQQHLLIACVVGLVVLVLIVRASQEPPARPSPLKSVRELLLELSALWLLFDAAPRALAPEAEDRYRLAACYRSSPELALWCSLAPEPAPPVQRAAPLALEPIIPLEAYLARVDRSQARLVNVVLVVVESMRADSLRAGGSLPTGDPRPILMPFLERLAEQGMVFRNAYAQSDATDCSLPALLSSLYPLRATSHDNLRDGRYPKTLIYDVLGGLGYRTAIFSSHNDLWGNLLGFLQSPALDVYFHPEVYDGETIAPQQDAGLWHWLKRGMLRKGSLDDRVTVQRFLDWVGSQSRQRPFFAYLNLQVAHFPYQLAQDIETPFLPAAIDFEATFHEYPRHKTETMRNRYFNSLRFADARLREVMLGLSRLGRSADTLVIVTGDHGQEFFEHGNVTHGKGLHEEVARVPLVVSGPPDLVPRRVMDRPVQHVDVMPTLLELLGLPPHPNFQGRSAVAREDLGDHRLFLLGQHAGRDYALVWRGYKYIDRSIDEVLYDLRSDPGERVDLADRFPRTAAECRAVLSAFRRAQHDYYGRPASYERFYPPRYP